MDNTCPLCHSYQCQLCGIAQIGGQYQNMYAAQCARLESQLAAAEKERDEWRRLLDDYKNGKALEVKELTAERDRLSKENEKLKRVADAAKAQCERPCGPHMIALAGAVQALADAARGREG